MRLLNYRNSVRFSSFGVASLLVLALNGVAHAQLQPGYVVLSTEHADVGVLSEDGSELTLHIHDEDNDIEYATDEALLHIPDLPGVSRFNRPAGAQWDFLGTPAGSSVWIAPQSQNTNLLYLGLANEDLTNDPGSAGKFTGQTTFSLVSVTGALGGVAPGNFSLYQTDGFGNPVPGFTSSNGIDATDTVSYSGFTHQHFNWAFTNLGIYEVTIRAEAARTTLGGGGTLVDERTYTFGIGTTDAPTITVVPEAGTLPMILGAGISVLSMVALRRRRVKKG